MSKTKLVQERIESLLIGQNQGQDIEIQLVDSGSVVQITIKTRAAFLQINNLEDVLDDTGFNRALFIIESSTTLNIQSDRFEYSVDANQNCIINSYFLKSEGTVDIKLAPDCTLNYKGSHNIKKSTNCIIKNANSST